MTRNARVVWQDDCDYIPLRDKRLDDIDNCEIPLVSANFVIPYPPGFPILVPGQQLSQAIIDFFRHLVRSFFLCPMTLSSRHITLSSIRSCTHIPSLSLFFPCLW
jgi:hypothetical protein